MGKLFSEPGLNQLRCASGTHRTIKLITLHSGKGTGFEAVAVINANDGRIPFFAARDDPAKVAEAQRQFHVGARAPRRRQAGRFLSAKLRILAPGLTSVEWVDDLLSGNDWR